MKKEDVGIEVATRADRRSKQRHQGWSRVTPRPTVLDRQSDHHVMTDETTVVMTDADDRRDDRRSDRRDDRGRSSSLSRDWSVSNIQASDRKLPSKEMLRGDDNNMDIRPGQQHGSMYCVLMVTNTRYHVLCDTGSVASFVHPRVLEDAKLAVTEPPDNDEAEIIFANPAFRQKRLGAVDLLVDVHMEGTTHQHMQPLLIRKKFEVMPINHHFLFGMDLLPFVHPIFRQALEAGMIVSDSRTTTPPIVYSQAERTLIMRDQPSEVFNGGSGLRSTTEDGTNQVTVCHVTLTEQNEDDLYRQAGRQHLLIDVENEQSLSDQDSARTSVILEAYREVVEGGGA